MPAFLNSSKTTLASPGVCTQTPGNRLLQSNARQLGEVVATKVSGCGTPVLSSAPRTAPPPTSRSLRSGTGRCVRLTSSQPIRQWRRRRKGWPRGRDRPLMSIQ